MNRQSLSVNSVLMWAPEEIVAWVRKASSDNQTVIGFNWLGLAHGASTKTFADEIPNLQWAQVAMMAYEHLAREMPQSASTFVLSAMMLRAKLISELGVHSENPILNVEVVFEWLLGQLCEHQEYLDHFHGGVAIDLPSMRPNEIQALRSIKNSLKVAQVIQSSNQVKLPHEIEQWLGIWESLP